MLDHEIILNNDVRFHVLDLVALLYFGCAWLSYTLYTNRSDARPGNLLYEMHQYRLNWMRQLLKRDNRMQDMSGVGNLLHSISFFANTSIFLVAGAMGLMGYRDRVQELIVSIPYAVPSNGFLWACKVMLLVMIFMHAFFKYSWSLRQFNYIVIYVGAAPLAAEKEDHALYAERGAWLMSNGARHFNLGLRAYYYGFAAITWLFHPLAFIVMTTVVIWVLYRREFHSMMYRTLSEERMSPRRAV